jgi:large subunit ribosomal protein L31e
LGRGEGVQFLPGTRPFKNEEGAKEKLYSYVQAVNVKAAKGLQTALVEDA